jgi:hypothetical protein
VVDATTSGEALMGSGSGCDVAFVGSAAGLRGISVGGVCWALGILCAGSGVEDADAFVGGDGIFPGLLTAAAGAVDGAAEIVAEDSGWGFLVNSK